MADILSFKERVFGRTTCRILYLLIYSLNNLPYTLPTQIFLAALWMFDVLKDFPINDDKAPGWRVEPEL